MIISGKLFGRTQEISSEHSRDPSITARFFHCGVSKSFQHSWSHCMVSFYFLLIRKQRIVYLFFIFLFYNRCVLLFCRKSYRLAKKPTDPKAFASHYFSKFQAPLRNQDAEDENNLFG
jgi:hypothetical protein